MPDKTSNF